MRLALVIALLSAACGRLGFENATSVSDGDIDAEPDAAPGPPVARVVTQAYWTNWFGSTFGTGGMSMTGYSVPTSGVVDGELLLLVACVDNGSDTVWPDPLGPGYTQLVQQKWGNDGQSCAVGWKIASSEPATYTGTYGPGIISGSSLISLVAFSAATPLEIGTFSFSFGMGTGTNPVVSNHAGVISTKNNALAFYMTGSDWECYEVSDVTFTVPTGWTQLSVLSDRGAAATKDWTIMQLATLALPAPADTGPISNTETSTGSAACVARPFTGAVVIQPAS